MLSRVQKSISLRRRLHILGNPTSSKSMRKSSIIMDAIYYINALKLKLRAINRDSWKLLNRLPVPMVKVEKIENGFLVKVTYNKGRGLLVSVLEAFEQVGLNVLQVRVSCNQFFCMEAIVTVQDQILNVGNLTQAIVKAIGKEGGNWRDS